MSSMEIQKPIFNEDDLDESEEDSDEEEEEEEAEDLNNNNNANPPHPTNLNDALVEDELFEEEEDDDVIDLDNDVTIAVPPPPQFTKSDQKRPQIDNNHVEKRVVVQFQQQQQPLDDSRKLFQRLWTDEDEIELLQGFLEYMTQRGISYHNHHDLGSFYEQIKSKLQLDFNKNQLVEKLRRLKRKYRNVLNRTSAGKEVSFKSPHDQATYEISSKIWSDLSSNKDVGGNGGGGFDDEDGVLAPMPTIPVSNLSPNPNYSFFGHSGTPVHYASQMNGVFDERKSHSTKKRSRVKIEDKRVSDESVVPPNLGAGLGGHNASVGFGPQIQGMIEETVKSCVSPMVKEAMQSAANGPCGSWGFGGGGRGGFGLVSTLALNFGSPSCSLGGEVSERKWRKQQIIELEVYSKRLELVQEQIKVALEELRPGRS